MPRRRGTRLVSRRRCGRKRLTKAKDDAEKRCASTSAEGFQHVVNLTTALAPCVDFNYFTGKYYAKDRKIWLRNEMVYDPALHREAQEVKEGSLEGENAEEEKADEPGAAPRERSRATTR